MSQSRWHNLRYLGDVPAPPIDWNQQINPRIDPPYIDLIDSSIVLSPDNHFALPPMSPPPPSPAGAPSSGLSSNVLLIAAAGLALYMLMGQGKGRR